MCTHCITWRPPAFLRALRRRAARCPSCASQRYPCCRLPRPAPCRTATGQHPPLVSIPQPPFLHPLPPQANPLSYDLPRAASGFASSASQPCGPVTMLCCAPCSVVDSDLFCLTDVRLLPPPSARLPRLACTRSTQVPQERFGFSNSPRLEHVCQRVRVLPRHAPQQALAS